MKSKSPFCGTVSGLGLKLQFFVETRYMSIYNNVENPQGQITVPVSNTRRDWPVHYNQPIANGGLSENKISVPVSFPRHDWLNIYNQPMDNCNTD